MVCGILLWQPELTDKEGKTINPHLDEDGFKANGDLELAGLGASLEVESETEHKGGRGEGMWSRWQSWLEDELW